MLKAVLYSILAGGMIPLGGLIAHLAQERAEMIGPSMRHFIIAFGGGALIAAVALVLVPQGTTVLPVWLSIACFLGGGVLFALIDRWVAERGGSRGQMLAMLADFLPEAIALGALFALGSGSAPLMAMLIALQNLPEGFNAYREAAPKTTAEANKTLMVFTALAFLGPIAALAGHLFISNHPQLLGAMMVTAAGGILYLIFEDVAPQAPMKNKWAPPFGAVAGFALGLLGHLVIH
ncbi:ZIP family metal transporter [Pseudoruegeria sp. HB172150]|uniref:ZIP family metal transporter n=1 Tax=Pseudoruegeria sp. HB172150 TaxID=2721164 RepID=UPI0015558FA6|nr:divalent cation transporter [Pseudoruegeria sp. HB172150]